MTKDFITNLQFDTFKTITKPSHYEIKFGKLVKFKIRVNVTRQETHNDTFNKFCGQTVSCSAAISTLFDSTQKIQSVSLFWKRKAEMRSTDIDL